MMPDRAGRFSISGVFVAIALAAATVAVTSTWPAAAEPDDAAPCKAVEDALHRLGAAARYHWKMSATTPARRRPFEREEVVLDDIVYVTPDEGRWMKERITAPERVARMADELARNPIRDCRLIGRDTRDGRAMLTYAYRQGSGAAQRGDTGGEAAAKRIWIGAADGLPHFFTSAEGAVSVTMQVEYDRVEAPLP